MSRVKLGVSSICRFMDILRRMQFCLWFGNMYNMAVVRIVVMGP